MKVKLSATIPVVQYGNIVPEFEVEADTYEEAMKIAEAQLLPIWNKYVENGKQLGIGNRQLVQCFVGGEIYYDDATHTYTNEVGEVYLSGSQYAQQFKKPFDKQKIAEATGKKFDVPPSEVIDFWELRSKTSMDFGTAIHTAIEFYGKYSSLAETLGKSSVHDHPILKTAVEGFLELAGNDFAVYEAFVVNHDKKHAGRIDRLLVKGKDCTIQDIKTGAVLKDEDLKVYWKQLELYADILTAGGYNVKGMEIYHYDGEWHKHGLH